MRTYVHRQGESPGVWFFSLDAAQAIACKVARRFFGLPYFYAQMSVRESGDRRIYRSERVACPAGLVIDAELAEYLGQAEPGTLEFFLIERYLLFSCREGEILTGRVHHTPYPLRKATYSTMHESLVSAAGIAPRPFVHTIASDGVDVEIYPLVP